jgi:3'-phosphoadenosine 5'-phosphosulfate sulfotransferase (PAPS reductase)/FAD synthetase
MMGEEVEKEYANGRGVVAIEDLIIGIRREERRKRASIW